MTEEDARALAYMQQEANRALTQAALARLLSGSPAAFLRLRAKQEPILNKERNYGRSDDPDDYRRQNNT